MELTRRQHGSQRAKRPMKVTLEPNFTGQGGTKRLTFKTESGEYLMFEPESDAEMRELLSEVHIVHHNFRETR
ncbi:hypothetical protein [Aureimonas sp. AU40]|uniref:hypothetical protein n=1 Tax=Aureimonas sp. AU40 TaxID=1637747 RepID=UPI0007855589|nr:hypothetical protein [Aureimonas sp. AU40]